MIRRLLNRFREDCAAAVREEVAPLQTAMEQSWTAALEDLRRDVEVQQRALAARRRSATERHDGLVSAVDRLAGALETLTALERDRRERPPPVDVLDSLLREMLIGGYGPLPGPARLVGGTIDARAAGVEVPDIDLSALESGLEAGSEGELSVGAPVQVRSHFQDRWSNGFEIAEIVEDGILRQFKLKRSYEDRPLPLLFDPADVRRQPVPSVAGQLDPLEECRANEGRDG